MYYSPTRDVTTLLLLIHLTSFRLVTTVLLLLHLTTLLLVARLLVQEHHDLLLHALYYQQLGLGLG